MVYSLLAEGGSALPDWVLPVVLAVLLVGIVAWFFLSNRKGKQRQQEYMEQLEALRPGHKVKSAGGLCGIVVEVCDDDTVIVETGSEKSGKSYFKLAKECIYQTDAKGPTQLAREALEAERKAAEAARKNPAPAAPAEAPVEEPAPAEAPVEEPVETPAPAEESAAE